MVSLLALKWCLGNSQWLTSGEVGNGASLQPFWHHRVPWAFFDSYLRGNLPHAKPWPMNHN